MKIFSLSFILLAAAATAAYTTRQRRDVSELAPPSYDYLPPSTRLTLPAAETTAPAVVATTEVATEIPLEETAEIPASVRGANGYEYRTVRRLKYRHRTLRDVSHLQQQQPHQRYLPPKSDYLPPQTVADNLDDSEVVEAPVLKIANEYLPPNEVHENEAPVTEAAELTAETEAPPAPDTEAPIESAVLAADGYHYRQPENPMEIIAQPKSATSAEYLPPLEKGVVEAEGPEGESAILADDGYHYRVVKRLRF